MSRITCRVCSKQFRTKGGHKWHLQHVHPPESRGNGDDAPSLAASQRADPGQETDRSVVDPVPPDDPGESVSELEQLHARLEELSRQYSDMSEAIASWQGRLDRIEMEMPRITKTIEEVSTLKRLCSSPVAWIEYRRKSWGVWEPQGRLRKSKLPPDPDLDLSRAPE